MSIKSYRDLDCWGVGLEIAREAYVLTSVIPKEEMFGFTSQVRRARTSIPANIADGHGRDGTKDFVRFLRIAQGSTKELETHLLVAVEVEIAAPESCAALLELCDREGRMLRALIRTLENVP